MNKQHILNLTWAKAFGEIYCHHASLFIPYDSTSLFSPEIISIGVTVRTNLIEKRKIASSFDKRQSHYLPCNTVEGGIVVPLNSSEIIEELSLNSWTSLKDSSRSIQKKFPINIYYKLEPEADEVILPFDHLNAGTPYMIDEPKFLKMSDGDKIDSTIVFEL